MQAAHEVAEVRRAEQWLLDRLPEGALMERAATGLATCCVRLLEGRRGGVYGSLVLLLVGAGNNGGDALVAGARLARRGAVVQAITLSPAPYEPGLRALESAGGRVVEGAEDQAAALAGADLVVDGIVGIGGRGGLRDDAVRLRDAISPTAAVVAVDLPSGLDADSGRVGGAAVVADVTVTFGTLKPGLLVDPGAAHAGRVEVVDIGLGPQLGPPALLAVDSGDVAAGWPWPTRAGDKYARGAVGVLAGSPGYPGAAVLCASGALRAGAGYVRATVASDVAGVLGRTHPEVVVTTLAGLDPPTEAGQVQAWATGPGMGLDGEAHDRLAAVLGTGLPVVADADALTLIARDEALLVGRDAQGTLLTPHAGELARLLGVERDAVEADRLGSLRAAVDRWGVTVLLKGATTLVATPGQPVVASASGPPQLATAGAGDVLTGVCGMLLAAGRPAVEAGWLAAWVHGAAARTAGAGGPLLASDVAEALPATLATLAP